MTETSARPAQLGIVLLQSPPGSSFDAEVDAIVARVAAAGLAPVKEGTVFRVRDAAGTATLTPEPAPFAYNEALAPMIAAHPDPGVIVERYKAHTGLIGVQVADDAGAGPAATSSLLTTVLSAVAGHATASVVVLPGERRFATAEELRASEPAPTVSEPAPSAPAPSAPEPALTAVVLLANAPRSLGEIVASFNPAGGEALNATPVVPRIDATINGHAFVIGGRATPVDDPGLGADLAISPMRQRLTPVVDQHRGAITVGLAPGADWPGAMEAFATVVATVLNRPDAGAVWIPAQKLVTTDVLFQGDAEQDLALTWARVHAGVLDAQQGSAFAFSQGLAALGGREVQLVATAEPARLFEDLRRALAAELARGVLPVLGGSLTLAGGRFGLVDGASVVGLGPVLDLRYVGPAQQ